MTHTVLITGANRGIGLELVKQYSAENWRVIACCRHPERATELQALRQKFPTISIHALDVTNEQQLKKLADALSDVAIDLLINNAGIYGKEHIKFGGNTIENLQSVFLTNAIAPLKMCEYFVEHVAASKLKKLITISTAMASIAENELGDAYAYRASKTAVNMLMKSVAIDLAPRGIKVLLLHPGWVQTAMGGPSAQISTETSVAGLRKVIAECAETGVFLGYDGRRIQW